ncbi:MAG: tRNA epoxyqueuosine(34) reductase QueG [Planctomycetaceae bacterium]|nr:tRNA epoxyqueuosine(34) reductase QueG [Planctomycetaceae bacterium]
MKAEAKRAGFDAVGIVPATSPAGFDNLQRWLQRGFDGEMSYISRRETAYEHPQHVMPTVKSVVMLAMNYHTEERAPVETRQGAVSRYAWGEADYHDLIRGKLRRLADFIHRLCPGCHTRGIIDTAPLLERDFARLAGLGWFGKNTMIINKQLGSWLFLAALLVDFDLEYDSPHDTSHCGTCTRCLDVCPTDAFPEPYVLDARRCISYLTIELRKPIPMKLRDGMGEWMFGCDLCQDVCPWNRKAPVTREAAFSPSADLNPVDAIRLLGMNDDEFKKRFAKTPLARPKRSGILRNAAIVLGNRRSAEAIPALVTALDDHEPLVRGATAWALGRMGGATAVAALHSRLRVEDNTDVLSEIRHALDHTKDIGHSEEQ